MMQPSPFTLRCPNCNWSKRIRPRGDVVDSSWGMKYRTCPKCGTPTERSDNSDLLGDTVEALKELLRRKD